MKEITLRKQKNGMAMMLLILFLYLLCIGALFAGGLMLSRRILLPGAVVLTAGILWAVLGWIPFLGLKVIRPQETLVLTLFGNYVGTLLEPGF